VTGTSYRTVSSAVSPSADGRAEWSTRSDHLREITRADVTAAIAGLTGYRRRQRLIALRSRFQ